MVQMLPEWATVQLDFEAKHVVFFLGPRKGHLSFIQPVRKFKDRLNVWAHTKGGSLLAVLAYKVGILPVLLFAAQLEYLPPDWPEYEQQAVQ